MENIIYLITLIVYSIFIIRFILSWFGGDFDLDSDADLDVSDVVSFKGLTHFLMGATSWLTSKSLLLHELLWYDYLIAFILGIIFVIILYYVYKLMMKLESFPTILSKTELIGKSAKIYLKNSLELHQGERTYIITVENGNGTFEYNAKSNKLYHNGDIVTILDYKDSYYII